MGEKIYPPSFEKKSPQEFLKELEEVQKFINELKEKGRKVGERTVIFAENISKEELMSSDFIERFNAIKHALGVERFEDVTQEFKKEFPESPVEKIFEASSKDKKTRLRMIMFKNQKTTIMGVEKGNGGK